MDNLQIYQAVDIGKPKVVKTVKKIDSINANQLYQEKLNPPVFTVEGLLPAGLITFAARPKTGKSWLCLDLADAVASGRNFWNRKTMQGDVLYLALEDSQYRIRQRLEQIGSVFPESLNIAVKGAESLDSGFIEQIQNWESEHNSQLRLLIIDTVVRIKGAGKRGLNANEADTAMFAPLQHLATERGFSIVCVTHFSKNRFSTDPFESISGSTALFAVSDACWVITGDRNETEKQLSVTGRDVENDQYRIEFVDCRWKMLGSAEELMQQRSDEEYRSNSIVITVRELLSDRDCWTGTASQLSEEVYSRTGTNLGHNTSAGKAIRKIIPELNKRDKICVSLPNKDGGPNGRIYTFKKTN